jgi:ATP-binding cassette subfamily B protein
MERLGEVFEMQEENYDTSPSELYRSKDIVLENVSFQYGTASSRPVLKDINLTIPTGKVTAIVGTSGSGKTTLVKLLLKFFNSSEGRVSIGDTDIKELGEKDWRMKCGVVMQDGFIFGDTMLRNITESELDERIDRKRLERAVEIANLRELVESLPLKFQTILSVGGMSLSGGENQRVLIARAVYKNPEFLFFDEATSALDARNERVIMERLGEFFEGKTVVVIAHRLSTVKNADNIVVLEKGEIVEQGTHDQLVRDEGYYYNLIKNQLELGA